MKTILCTVGSEKYQFDRLMRWIEIVAKQFPNYNYLVQSGSSNYIPKANNIRSFSFLPENEFTALFKKADIIIGHCGEGTIMQATALSKPYILIPRKHSLNEHVDDHQFELARLLKEKGAGIAFSLHDLKKEIANPKFVAFRIDQKNAIKFLEEILITSDSRKDGNLNFQSTLLLVCSGGGHYNSMLTLREFYEKFPHRHWATFKIKNIEIGLKDEDVIWAFHPTIRNIPNLLRNLYLAFKTIPKIRPDIVITTGAGISVPFLFIAKVFCGSRIVFIELATRLEGLSLSAKILYRLGIIDWCFVRHEKLKDLYKNNSKIVLIDDNLFNNSDIITKVSSY